MPNGIQEIEFWAISLLSLFLWIAMGFRWIRDRQWPIIQESRMLPPIGLLDLLVIFLLWISLQSLGLMFWVRPSGEPLPDDLARKALCIKSGELAAMILGLVYLALRYRTAFLDTFLAKLGRNAGIGLMAGLMLIPVLLWIHYLASQWVPYEHPTVKNVQQSNTTFVLLVSWATAVGIAPFSEEILCRSGIQTWLRGLRSGAEFDEINRMVLGGGNPSKEPIAANDEKTQKRFPQKGSTWMAIVVSAAFFGFLHLSQGLAIVPLTVMALVLGYIYERTGSIIPCIVVHLLLNAHTMFWLTFSK